MTKEEKIDLFLQKILVAVDNGENLLLYGGGGTGKSHTIKEIAVYIKNSGKKVACCATTGVAAINLNVPEKQITATTLHRWAGIGLAQGVAKKLYAKVQHDDGARARWLTTDVLIIDEVSMLGGDLFEKLDYIGRHVRLRKDVSFGGLQIIFSGDFLQLPPIKDEWIFKSYAWKDLPLTPFVFKEPKRYDDVDYFNLLNRVRVGDHTKKDRQKLYARTKAYDKLISILKESDSSKVIKPTILHSKRLDVEYHNEMELKKLPGITKEYISDDTFTAFNDNARYDYYIGLLDNIIPKAVPLKVGAQVMLKINLDISNGLANGSRGVVMEVTPEYVYVRFVNGQRICIKKHTWLVEDKDGKATRSQVPFILAWAMTVHKAQGCTLDYAICDLGPSIFAPGQAYVALSRVRNINGLFLSEFWPSSIMVNKTALQYTRELEYETKSRGKKKKPKIILNFIDSSED